MKWVFVDASGDMSLFRRADLAQYKDIAHLVLMIWTFHFQTPNAWVENYAKSLLLTNCCFLFISIYILCLTLCSFFKLRKKKKKHLKYLLWETIRPSLASSQSLAKAHSHVIALKQSTEKLWKILPSLSQCLFCARQPSDDFSTVKAINNWICDHFGDVVLLPADMTWFPLKGNG